MFDIQRFANISVSGGYTAVSGTSYNDIIQNIWSGSGGDYVSIYAGDGADSIYNDWGYHLVMDAGYGNDTITDYKGSYNSIYGGAGNDIISLRSVYSYETVRGGYGNDTIYGDTVNSYGTTYQYFYGDGNDVIKNYKSNDTISIGGNLDYTTLTSGNDIIVSVQSSGTMTLVDARYKTTNIKGGYYVSNNGITKNNYTKNTTVNGGSLADTINNYAGGVKIYAGSGNDIIYNSTGSYYTINSSYGYVTIDGGAGNDSIYSNDPHISINGGAGNDTIRVGNWSANTVRGGTGNDLIYGSYSSLSSYGILYQYDSGDGYDTIYGFNQYDTLKINGSYSTLQSGNDFIYSLSGGAIYLKNYKPSTGGKYIKNSTSRKTLTGTSYGDTIENIYSGGGDYVSINAGAGADTIYNNYGYYLTVNADEGNDTITDYRGSSNKIYGGAGNDKISVKSNNGHITIEGGTGNDTIYGDSLMSGSYYGIVYKYSSGDGNDVIYNYKSSDTLDLGNATYSTSISGNDVIFTVGTGKVTLVGAKGKVGSINSIFSDSDDYYFNSTYSTILNALAGDDTIYNYANYVTINAGDGQDKIYNSYGYYLSFNGGAGADSIYNYYGTYSTINTGADNDTVYNYNSDKASIDLGDGADYMYAYDNDTVTVYAGNGNDTVTGSFYNSKIYGGTGNDYISVSGGSYNTIDGGDGDDTIKAYGGSINGGAGDDKITVSSSYYSTINAGTGNDTIYSSASYGSNYYQYTYGDGNDIIYGYKNGDVVSIAGNSEYTTLTNGSNAIISVTGSGAITLDSAAYRTISVRGGTYKPATINPNDGIYIKNSTSYRTISGSSNNDTIQNIYSGGGDYVSINTGAGNDTIYTNYSWNLTIDAGTGNDTITAYRGSRNSINGGAGHDRISLSSSSGMSVIKGGAGNDTIYGDNVSHLYQYANGDGNDIIYGHNNSDSIEITSGAYSTVKSGQNVIIKVTSGANSTVSTGAITLSGAYGHSINIQGTKVSVGGGDDTGTGGGNTNTTVTSVTQQEVIQTFMGVLDTVDSSGISALNQAVSIASGGYFTNINAAVNQMIADCQNAGSGSNFLTQYCGINLNNTDTGAITGSDAGGSTTKTANSIVPESGNLINFTGSNFTTNGLTVQLANINSWGNISNLSYSSLTNKQKYMWQGLYTWWLDSSFDLISESYGNNYGFDNNSSATVKKMYVEFYRGNDNTLAYVTNWSYPDEGKAIQLSLSINMNYYDSVNTSDPNGSSSVTDFYLDRTLAHELTHAVMAANIRYFNNLPKFIKEGMAELTHGIDDERQYDINYLANNPSVLQNALSMYSNSYYAYAGGYMFLRYLAKQGAQNGSFNSGNGSSDSNMLGIVSRSNNASGNNVTTQRGINVSGNVLKVSNTFDEELVDLSTYSSTVTKVNASALTTGVMIVGNTRNNSINAGKSADTISGNTGKDTIYGGNGNDILFGDAGDDKLYGENGNDTISGGYGKNTLTGGKGKDIFIHNGGNDFITDYKAGEDKIQFDESDIVSSSISGSNVILTTANGSVTVKGGKGNKITVIDKDGNETTKKYTTTSSASENAAALGVSVGTSVITVKSSFGGDEIDLADYSTTVTKVNASAVTKGIEIIGNAKANSILGGKGADTLNGGKGNDTLTGGKGNDVFIYSGGKDVITDYTANQDTIKIASGTITKTTYKNKDVIFTIGSGTLTVKNGKSKKITIIDSGNKTTTQTYSKTSTLFEDNNFVTDALNLDSITEKKYSVQNIQTENYNSLAQDTQNYLTFAKEK